MMLVWWLVGLCVVPLCLVLYMRLNPQFGGRLTRANIRQYEKSKQWDGKKFANQTDTRIDIGLKDIPGLLRAQFIEKESRIPDKPLPIKPFDPGLFTADDNPKFIWYGHSVVLLQINGKNLLIDPMLGADASPIAPFSAKRFSENALDIIDTLPALDAVLMTHDHYDHLDYSSFKRLRHKADVFLVALGVSRHLESWGIPKRKIQEFDWLQEIDFQGIKMTFTPSRHFSGRGINDRWKSLWGGWVFHTAKNRIYWSGDGGYGDHFKEIGKKFGPFDWAFVECGQYYQLWQQIHMMPEESVQAGIDAQAEVIIPVHWGGFSLSLHTWKDPIERFVAEAGRKHKQICTPEIGDVITFGMDYPVKEWWNDYK
jgi:L-ascorbate metabolism protein UlaG (beta-lactamase superfamily)